ncbi:hypothetical protein FRZ06_08495 [Anoxybacterium hadale]|uniref:Uncharacterized protein n=1 Tax=Anoxybacterium hadale TaxID=3408580 RepID=A0ACD1AAN7_9FIRM|nr:hypothetical protein FRZ06_08495 [Clostridiales bacterium]
MEKRFKMGVGLGGPSIIMIFVVLSLTTLGALALMTAHADWNLTKRTADSVTAYYSADSKAEELLAETDFDLKSGLPVKDTFILPVQEGQDLLLKLKFSGVNYSIVARKLTITSQWDYDQFNVQFNDQVAE